MKKIIILGTGASSVFNHSKYDKYKVVSLNIYSNSLIPSLSEWSNKDIAAVLFTGGEDVHPSLYGENREYGTWTNYQRDLIEKAVFEKCYEQGIHMIGICRGMQLLNVLMGGKMIQHVDGHLGHHNIRTKNHGLIPVNSIHHQVVVPSANMEVVATSEEDELPEAIVNQEFGILGVQYHPEMLNINHEGHQYFQSLIDEYDIL